MYASNSPHVRLGIQARHGPGKFFSRIENFIGPKHRLGNHAADLEISNANRRIPVVWFGWKHMPEAVEVFSPGWTVAMIMAWW